MAQRDGSSLFDLTELLQKGVIAFFSPGDLSSRAPNVGLTTVFTQQPAGSSQCCRRSLFDLRSSGVEPISQLLIEAFERQARFIRAAVIFDPEDICDLIRQSDGGKQPPVPVNFV